MALVQYRDMGQLSYNKVLRIPVEERIPNLVKDKEGRLRVLTALTAALKSAFDNIYLKSKPGEDALVMIADEIINQSHQDHLSLQDVVLFLGELLSGNCGKLFDRIDMPTFFEKFEIYRQKRWEEIRNYRDELACRFRDMGRTDQRPTVNLEGDASTMLDLMQSYYGKDESE